jgi:hypothetical protein
MRTRALGNRSRGLAVSRAIGVALAAALASGDARAWGKVGHRAAAIVADRLLSPAAHAKVRDLLDPAETLADASTWADDHRRDIPGSGAWHYVNVPLGELRYDARFCPPSGCVVSKIRELEGTLANASAPREDRKRALRLLVHLVEDVHQPLHVGDAGDRGGNDLQVRFFGHGTNLHRVWDEEIIERHSTDELAWAAELEQLARTVHVARGEDVTLWADESLVAARVAYAVPGSVGMLKPGANLESAYFDSALPLAKKRLALAAARLASTLNEIFQ